LNESNRWSTTLSFEEEWVMDLAGFIEDRGLVDSLIFHGTGIGRDNTNIRCAKSTKRWRGDVIKDLSGVDRVYSGRSQCHTSMCMDRDSSVHLLPLESRLEDRTQGSWISEDHDVALNGAYGCAIDYAS
jgi:hypothetical protein